jgi:hypothetical protein
MATFLVVSIIVVAVRWVITPFWLVLLRMWCIVIVAVVWDDSVVWWMVWWVVSWMVGWRVRVVVLVWWLGVMVLPSGQSMWLLVRVGRVVWVRVYGVIGKRVGVGVVLWVLRCVCIWAWVVVLVLVVV